MSYQQKKTSMRMRFPKKGGKRERTEDDGLLMIPASNKRKPVAKEMEKELLQ